MSSPVLPSPDEASSEGAASSAPADARPGIRAVWIGALAGGLTAALVSGAFGLYTSQVQISAEDRRDAASFLRAEQRDAYQEFISELRRFNVTFSEQWAYVSSRQATQSGIKAEVDSAFYALAEDYDALVLVSSAEVNRTANQILDNVVEQTGLLESMLEEVNYDPDTDPSSGRKQEQMFELFESYGELRSQLVTQARLELGAGALVGDE